MDGLVGLQASVSEPALCYARQIDRGGETVAASERCASGQAVAGGVLSLEIAAE